MKQQLIAFTWLKIWGLILLSLSVGIVLILAEPQRLSYFSLLLFEHQEALKTGAILAIFIGAFFLFYASSKVSERYLKVILCKGSMKVHPDLIKESLEKWFVDQNIQNFKLISVTIVGDNQVGLELITPNLDLALYSLEDVEFRLKAFMGSTFAIHTPIEVQLFESN